MATIFIGDIHGCSREFRDLLAVVSPTADDRLILMGDLINKGPDPAGVLATVESLGCVSLRGNHEADHLKWRTGNFTPKPDSITTKSLFTPEAYERFLAFAAAMPLYIDEPAFLAVHAALQTGLPLDQQIPEILTGEKTLPNSWKDGIDVGKPLIVGHKRFSKNQADPFIVEGRFYGLDTGCVYGGALTALSLPSGQIWQIPASRTYAREAV